MDVPERIRKRRKELGLTGHELARMVSVSPSTVSLIESGRKVPGEELAAKIAHALQDSEQDYRLWASTARISEAVREAMFSTAGKGKIVPFRPAAEAGKEERTDESRTGAEDRAEEQETESDGENPETGSFAPEQSQEHPASEELVDAESAREIVIHMAEETFKLASPTPSALSGRETEEVHTGPGEGIVKPAARTETLFVPLLSEAAGLDDGPVPGDRIAGEIPLRGELRALVGEDSVALTVTATNGAGIASQLRQGDIVVLDRRWAGIRADSIYAVRGRDSLRFCRCAYRNGSLQIVSDPTGPSAGAAVDVIHAPDEEALRRLIAGRVALSLRFWR